MTGPLRVFVSSVQKELESERLIVQNLIQTDPFLSAHCTPVLYESEPASPEKAREECLHLLAECQVYLLIVGVKYGSWASSLSITHTEYRRAKEQGLPTLIFIKGDARTEREDGTKGLITEIVSDGTKYKGFSDIIQLQEEVRNALVQHLKRSGSAPTRDENEIANQTTIEATSPFETRVIESVCWENLDHEIARQLISAAENRDPVAISPSELLTSASIRSLARYDPQTGRHHATAAGILLLAPDPSAIFPQCRILADAYRGTEADGDPRDHEDIRVPLPAAVDRAIAFIDRNTRHPMKVIGLNRVRLDEYPVEALREALVNALVHRKYEEAGRKIILEVFFDRIVVSSQGLPPAPLNLARLRKGNYRQCSRNPVLAQCLSFFHRLEERRSGFRRMRDQMLDHGLDRPVLDDEAGYFQVTFPGPADDLDRLRVPIVGPGITVAPAIEAQLNERQRRMAELLVRGEELTSRRCLELFGITRDTASQDFAHLVDLGIAVRVGSGRSTRYRLAVREEE
ncbi:MAG TPA: DUF4062 domain-containing protein [Methanoregulaceae archaeon]|nr:DUF4062 domain-containing protein [Methanoregulaceae archaeon]